MKKIWDQFRKSPLNGTNRRTGPTLMISPVQALLHSNRAPTEDEVILIRNSIATAEFEIEQIQNSLGFNAIHDDSQINSYKLFIHLQSALLFRQLPPVILKKIFLFFAEGDENPLSNKPPWILGHVCRTWRAVALVNPRLWAHLPPIRLGNPCDVPRIFNSLLTLLHRCSRGPISFFLHCEVADPTEYPIIDLLVAHSEQWGNVSLEVSGITIRRFFKIDGRLDSLRSLEFSLRGRGEPVVSIFESAPWLRTVRVNDLVSPGMLRLPWTQLTTYEDKTTFGDGVFKAFRLNSNLRHIKFRPNHDEHLESFPKFQWRPLIIPYLTTLSIEFWDRRYKIKTLFDNLTLPALQTLVLKFSKYDNVTDIDLVKMINRSLCELKHLTFHGRDSPIRQFLAVMPFLRTLDINDPDEKLIDKLSQFHRGGEWTVLPRLSSLTIHLSMSYKHPYLASLSRLAGIRCDTVTTFRQGRPTPFLRMLKTLRVAIHGTDNHSLSHFYYASLEPPRTDMEERSADRIAKVYASIMVNPILLNPSTVLPFKLDGCDIINEDRSFRMETGAWKRRGRIYADTMSGLTNIMVSDPQAVAGVYLSGIDYDFYRLTKEFSKKWSYYTEEISDFHSEVEQWGLKLVAIAPVLKWNWDDDGYLVYIPFEDRQFTRATPKFKSQRSVYRKTPPDQFAAAKSFRTLKVEESLEASRRNIMPGKPRLSSSISSHPNRWTFDFRLKVLISFTKSLGPTFTQCLEELRRVDDHFWTSQRRHPSRVADVPYSKNCMLQSPGGGRRKVTNDCGTITCNVNTFTIMETVNVTEGRTTRAEEES